MGKKLKESIGKVIRKRRGDQQEPLTGFYHSGEDGSVGNRLCHGEVLYQGEMSPEQELRTSIWYTRQSEEMDVDCYFWCTEDGELPQRHPDREDAREHLEDIVRTVIQ